LLGAWVLFTFWLGLVPIFLGPVYYGFTKPSDFDTILQTLRRDGLVWAVRVGSASCSKLGIGVLSSTFGLNAENPDFERGRIQVWDGRLERTYQATYLAYFRGSRWTTVFTVSRSVGPNGEVSLGVWQNGSKPIVHYLLWSVLAGLFAVVFFEVVSLLRKKFSQGH
jgi:hypothetical protein